jgi:DNA-binding transcriptional ArsR family regulator
MMDSTLTEAKFHLDAPLIEKGLYTIVAINHKQRFRILRLLYKHKYLKVKQIYKALNMEQSVASLHLSILRRSGLVINKRKGQSVYYFINYNLLERFTSKNFRNIFPKTRIAEF